MSDLRPRTLWIADADGWRHCPLHMGKQTVGRDMSCGVLIQHPRISRRHIEIECDDSGTFVIDLGSANGSKRNGAPIAGRQRLLPGDTLLLGPVEIRVGEPEAAFPAPRGQAGTSPTPSRAANSASTAAPSSAPQPPVSTASSEQGSSERIRRATRGSRNGPLLVAALLLILGVVGLWKAGMLDSLQEKIAPIATAPEVAERPLEDLVPTGTSSAAREQCSAAFAAALASARYGEAETLALSADAAPELAAQLRHALETLVQDLKQDAASIAQSSGHAAAALHLRKALETLPYGSLAQRHLEQEARLHAVRAEEIAEASEAATTDAGKPASALVKPEPVAPIVAKETVPESVGSGSATAEDVTAAQTAWQQRDLQTARKLAGTIIAGRSAPAMRRAAEKVLRAVENHELLADALAGGLSRVPERKWPGQSAPCTLRAHRAGLSAQNAGGVQELPWKVVSADLMAAAITASALEAPAQICAAQVLRELGHGPAADEMLAKALLRDSKLRERADRVIADGLDLAEVPQGGFVWMANAWITASDAARRARREDIDKDGDLLGSTKPEVRDPAFERLLALGDISKAAMRRGLLKARSSVLTEMRKAPGFDALEKLVQTRLELDKRREFAKELIFDTTQYPYPYRPPEADEATFANYRKSQPEVDRRVQAVRDLWNSAKPIALPAALFKQMQRLEEIGAMAQRADIELEEEYAWLSLLPQKEVSLMTIALNARDRERIEISAEVLKANETKPGKASPGEREQCRITNDYRVMMGCWSLRLYERLVRASRGHCEDMSRLGFFAHESRVEGKRTPYDRICREGMKPEGSSENIAINGSASGAHNAWVHSPGHHRNILMPAWRLMGPGNNGHHWCQNFSVRDMAPLDEDGR